MGGKPYGPPRPNTYETWCGLVDEAQHFAEQAKTMRDQADKTPAPMAESLALYRAEEMRYLKWAEVTALIALNYRD